MQIVGETIVYDGTGGGSRSQSVPTSVPNNTFQPLLLKFEVIEIGGAAEGLFVVFGNGARTLITSPGIYALEVEYTTGGAALAFANADGSTVYNTTSWTIGGFQSGSGIIEIFNNPVEFLNTAKFFDSGSKINFNPFGALNAALPTAYEHSGVVPADAYLYMNKTFAASDSFSPEAQDAIDNLGITEDFEKQYVSDFVNELVAQGNYDLIDDLMILGLRGGGLGSMRGLISATNNGATFLPGIGYDFDGTDDFIDTGFNPAAADFGVASYSLGSSLVTTPFTGLQFGDGAGIDQAFSITFNMLLNADNCSVISGHTTSQNNRGWGVYVAGNGTMRWKINSYDQAGTIEIFAPSAFKPLGTKMFYFMSYDGSKTEQGLQMFSYNLETGEVQEGTGSLSSGTYNGILDTLNQMTVGRGTGVTNNGPINGQLWDVRVHSEVLTEEQIATARRGLLVGTEISRWRLDGVDFTDSVGSNDGTPTDVTQALINNKKYSLNDALIGAYVYNNRSAADFAMLYGAEGTGTTRTRFYQYPTNGQLNFSINAGNGTTDANEGRFNRGLYITTRDSAGNQSLKFNGLERATLNIPSVGLDTNTVWLAANNFGTPNYLDATLSLFVAGAAEGFDHPAFYASVQKLLERIELGNEIKDILIYEGQILNADDIRRVYAFINEATGQLYGLQDYEAQAVDNLIRNERSVGS